MISYWVETRDTDWTTTEFPDALRQFFESGVHRVYVVIQCKSRLGINVFMLEVVTD